MKRRSATAARKSVTPRGGIPENRAARARTGRGRGEAERGEDALRGVEHEMTVEAALGVEAALAVERALPGERTTSVVREASTDDGTETAAASALAPPVHTPTPCLDAAGRRCRPIVARLRRLGRPLGGVVIAALFAGASGCNREMRDQPRYEPLEMSSLFQDGSSARTPVPGTIARGELREDAHFYRGMTADGELASTLPVPLSRELLARGQERFDIYCSVCHGRTGNGLGMIVRRGFKQPSSFHIDRLREVPIAYFFDVMTNGFGVMSSYASQVEPADRWAIAAYIRTLQLSQNARLAELPEAVRRDFNESLEDAARAAAGAATAGNEQGHH